MCHIPLSTFSIHATVSNFNQGQNLGQKKKHPPHQWHSKHLRENQAIFFSFPLSRSTPSPLSTIQRDHFQLGVPYSERTIFLCFTRFTWCISCEIKWNVEMCCAHCLNLSACFSSQWDADFLCENAQMLMIFIRDHLLNALVYLCFHSYTIWMPFLLACLLVSVAFSRHSERGVCALTLQQRLLLLLFSICVSGAMVFFLLSQHNK